MPPIHSTKQRLSLGLIGAAVCSTLLAFGCSGNGSGTQATAASAKANSPADDSTLGTATFSALLDGESVSGGPIDNLQQQNAAYTLPSDGNKTADLLFYLSDMTPGEQSASRVTHSFRLQVPKATGAATAAYMSVSMNLDPTHSARYSMSGATVTILSITATRVTGTFSGTMKLSPDFPDVKKQTITVTNGKFDIPLATSKLYPS